MNEKRQSFSMRLLSYLLVVVMVMVSPINGQSEKRKIVNYETIYGFCGMLQRSEAPDEQKLQHLPDDTSEEKLTSHSEVLKYRDAITDLRNGEESPEALQRYGETVRKLLNIQGNFS